MTLVTLAGVLLAVWAHYLPSPWDGLVLAGGAPAFW